MNTYRVVLSVEGRPLRIAVRAIDFHDAVAEAKRGNPNAKVHHVVRMSR